MNCITLILMGVLTQMQVSTDPPAYSRGILKGIDIPTPSFAASIPEDELKDLSWIHFAVPDFVILSIDKQQGLYLSQNIQLFKTWILDRWGLDNLVFSKPVFVVCVPNKDLMSKLFQLKSSYSEVRMKNDKIDSIVLWLVLDAPPPDVIPNSLTIPVLEEFKQASQWEMPFWVSRGMAMLNKTTTKIREDIKYLSGIKTPLDIDAIVNMTEEKFKKLPEEQRKMIDKQCAVLTLLIRKEYGQDKLHLFLKDNSLEELGFKNRKQFEGIVHRYYQNLMSDVVNNVTPDQYLDIKRKEVY